MRVRKETKTRHGINGAPINNQLFGKDIPTTVND